MKKIIFLFIFAASVCSLSAQESGFFLKLPMSARGAAMGDAFTAAADEPLGTYYNPAGIASLKRPAVSFVHHIYLQDITGDSVGVVLPVGGFVLGLAPTSFKMKEEAVYDSFGNDTGQTYGYQSMIIPLAVARRFGPLAAGAALKSYSETIDGEASKTTAFDVGATYSFKKLRLGFASQNLGGKIFDYPLAKLHRLGAAYAGAGYSVALDAVKEGTAGSYLNVGGEYSLLEMIRLRAGLRLREEFGGPTFGLGFNVGSFVADYAFVGYGDLGTTHKMGLSYMFGTSEKKSLDPKPAGEKAAQPPDSGPMNVAVAEFVGKNVSEADASIVEGFLRTALVGGGLFNVMDRDNMDAVLAEQKFQNSGCTEQQCAVEMGKLLNVSRMLVGSLSKLLDTYYITVNVIDVETGTIIASYDADAANSKELKEACQKIVKKISAK